MLAVVLLIRRTSRRGSPHTCPMVDVDSLPAPDPGPRSERMLAVALRLLLVFGLLYAFLVAIGLMGDSIKAMGKGAAGGMFDGVSNPFAGLAVGVLATVLVQSSSTTTATIVALVGQAGPTALPLSSAVPMVMGANIGTTITNTIVSIGHVRQGAEFRRAFAAATVHDFFNLLCVLVILPLEIAFGLLQHVAEAATELLASGGAGGVQYKSPVKAAVDWAGDGIVDGVAALGLDGRALAITTLVLGIALTFVCLVYITKNMKVLISGAVEKALNQVLGRSGLLGIGVGALITVAVQSSSITTSLLVPMCAAGVLSLRNAFPIMLGANIGTTVTGLLASMATETSAGLTIALVHLLFNLLGTLLFFPIPALRGVPIACAEWLAAKAQQSKLWVVAYVLGVFVVVPAAGYFLFQ